MKATVVLLRHADPVTGPGAGTNPPLSAAGEARLAALLHTLESMSVDAVFHSEFLRTRQTAEAVAAAAGVTAEQVAAADMAGLVSKLRALGRGSTAVVVGHSDTVPELIALLGGGTVPAIAMTEFDNLYIVDGGGAPRTHHLHYGAKT